MKRPIPSGLINLDDETHNIKAKDLPRHRDNVLDYEEHEPVYSFPHGFDPDKLYVIKEIKYKRDK